MKIRTDFVTNSSSSCFCAITITLKDQTKLHWEDDCFQDNLTFNLWELLPQDLENMQTSADLLLFLKKYACSEKRLDAVCNKLAKAIHDAESLDCFESLDMSCNEYLSDQGFSPDDGAEGCQLTYHFSTGKYQLRREPDPQFVADMNSMFFWE